MPHHASQAGKYLLSAQDDDLVRALSGAAPRDTLIAHPIHAYLGALGGLETPIGNFCRSIGVDFDAGPVLGRCEIAFTQPFHIDSTYDVALQVDDLERKPSRTYGAADHLALTIKLHSHGALTSTLRFTMITPATDHPRPAIQAPTYEESAAPMGKCLPHGPVSGPDMAVWCRLLNDDNAIHLSSDAATRAGFDGKRVNPGPANLAYLISARMRLYPQRPLSALHARFHGNVFEGDFLTCVIAPQGASGSLIRTGHPLMSVTFME